jgi:hypothetical protein
MRRVIAAASQGATNSIEARVAQKKGWVELFSGTAVTPAAAPAAEWPRPVSGWECSDGTMLTDQVAALKHELELARGQQRRAA